MIFGVQIIAIVFIALMMYFTFVNYKRKSYEVQSLILWMIVWLGAIFLVIFPKTVYGIMETLEIQRTADFFTLIGFAFLVAVIFYMYSVVSKNNYKIEQLVREIAIKEASREDKKRIIKKKK